MIILDTQINLLENKNVIRKNEISLKLKEIDKY